MTKVELLEIRDQENLTFIYINWILKLNRGEIFIDGLRIKNFDREWYNIISYVPRNILTLDENLKDNITLGEKKINLKHLNKILKILNNGNKNDIQI